MRCHICNSTLAPESTQWNALHNDWEPCPTCLLVIADVFSDPLDEEQITFLLEEEGVIEEDIE